MDGKTQLQSDITIISPVLRGQSYNLDNNTVWWENDYGRLEVYPANANNICQQVQYANVTSNITNDIDVAFRFPFKLNHSLCDIWFWQNISHNVKIWDYGWIPTNFTLYNITDYDIIDKPESVDLGNLSDTGTFICGNATFFSPGSHPNDWITREWVIGFDSFYWHTPAKINATFNYSYYDKIGYHYEQQYWFDWNSKKQFLNYQLFNGKHYYYIQNLSVVKDKTYHLKWQYHVPINSNGKWDLLAKLNSDPFGTIRINIDPWWDSNWTYYRQIIIESDYVDTTLTNFPILFNSTNTDFISKCDGGNSIRFIAGDNSGGTENSTEYYYEIEEWTTGGIDVWVNVSRINANEDTHLMVYYNNSVAVDDQNPNGVWDSNFLHVYHMNDNDLILNDSTVNNNDATEDATDPPDADDYQDDGQISYCVNYDGSGSGTTSESHDVPDVMSNAEWEAGFSISVWYYAKTGDYRTIIDYQDHTSIGIRPQNNDTVTFFTYSVADGYDWLYSLTTVNDNWYHIRASFNGTNKRLWANEEPMHESTINNGLKDNTQTNNIGANWNDQYGLNGGRADEARLSNIPRNDTWHEVDYHTQNLSSGFLILGNEQEEVEEERIWQEVLQFWFSGGNVSSVSKVLSF